MHSGYLYPPEWMANFNSFQGQFAHGKLEKVALCIIHIVILNVYFTISFTNFLTSILSKNLTLLKKLSANKN